MNEAVLEEIKKSVEQGAVWFDMHHEDGFLWFERINLGILHMSNARCCILGQLYGMSYGDALEAVFGSYDFEASSLGLNIPLDLQNGDDSLSFAVLNYYNALQAAWTELIQARLRG